MTVVDTIDMQHAAQFLEASSCACAVYLGIFEVKYFRSNLFDLHPDSGKSPLQDSTHLKACHKP